MSEPIATTASAQPKSISDYLIERLHAYGAQHVFGVPGDYVITLYHCMQQSGLLQPVNTCDEQGAGFMADVYGRLRGIGVVAVVFGVGGFKVLNTTAQAYTEKSPVVVISGAPGVRERVHGTAMHHLVDGYESELKAFQNVTVAQTILDDPKTAFKEIDRVLSAALTHKRPVYIQIPRDMYLALGDPNHIPSEFRRPGSNQRALGLALAEADNLISQSKQPVVWAGEELQRFGLKKTLIKFVEGTGIPFATSVLGKGLVSESHPLSMGVYNGKLAPEDVRQYVEASDCPIILGMQMTDLNLGFFTSKVDLESGIWASADHVSIKGKRFEHVGFEDFVIGLAGLGLPDRDIKGFPRFPQADQRIPFRPVAGKKLTTERVFEAINAFADKNMVITSDNGETSWAGVALTVHEDEGFFSPGYYASVGFSLPTALGAQFARPERRSIALVGDGAFQMTGVELSTASRYGIHPIVVVMNNGGYGTERPLFNEQFDDVVRWDYSLLTQVFKSGTSYTVETEDQLQEALFAAKGYTDGFVILDVHLEVGDYSAAFKRFIELFAVGAK